MRIKIKKFGQLNVDIVLFFFFKKKNSFKTLLAKLVSVESVL